MFASSAVGLALILAAAAPMRHALRSDVTELLTSARGTGDRTSVRTRELLLAAHAGLSLVLMTGALSLVSTAGKIRLFEQGVELRRTVFLSVRPSFGEYAVQTTDGARRQEGDFHQVVQRITALAGVQYVTYGDAPLPGDGTMTAFVSRGDGEPIHVEALVLRGGPGYANAVGARVVDGRDLTAADLSLPPKAGALGERETEGLPVGAALLESSLARRLWPAGSPVGQLVSIASRDYRVIGVLSEILPSAPSRLDVQMAVAGRTVSGDIGQSLPPIIVRTRPDPGSLRSTLASVAREGFLGRPDVRVQRLDSLVEQAMGNEYMGAVLFVWFGTAATALGVVGIYGLVAFLVVRGRREIAVRAALGASYPGLTWRLVRRALIAVATGVAMGLVLAYAMQRGLDASIVGLDEIPPTIYIAAASGFLVIASAASGVASMGIRRFNLSDLLRSE